MVKIHLGHGPLIILAGLRVHLLPQSQSNQSGGGVIMQTMINDILHV